ncbi:sodium/potassium/calcium exchanger 4-like [Montipora foliosa]|uniref:sodium/potassium/calcium exchanger 4-like n=1 Tax=Montipora foliosa TaxID=591990 RepID=UPI0035F1D7FC
MTRRRRFKVQLGIAAVLMVFIFNTWNQEPRKPLSFAREASDGSFTRRDLLSLKTNKHKNCSTPSVAEFPGDLFNQHQRKHGAVILHFVAVFYLSWAVAIVCHDYFVPCLELICEKLKLQSDVAGATLMAFGSSGPELFASVIGVFITHGDIGIGTILGSAVFNVLFVIGLCGVGAGTVLYLAWWPFVRDNMFYLFSLVILIVTLMDNIVTWPEALGMVCSYSIYLVIMYFNPRIEAWLYRITNTSSPKFKSDLHAVNRTNKTNNNAGYEKIADEEQGCDNQTKEEKPTRTTQTTEQPYAEKGETARQMRDDKEQEQVDEQDEFNEGDSESLPLRRSGSHLDRHYASIRQPQSAPDLTSPFNPPKGLMARICWLLGLPINIMYYVTIPNVQKESCHKWVAITFIASIIWIAISSYTLVWMVTTIGYTFGISDAMMGLTLVAFGSSIPDCSSSVLTARKGDGDMAVSNTIGSNTFDVLLCLGVPWLVKTTVWNHTSPVVINSHGLFMSCFFIIGSVIIAFLILCCTKWVLNRKVGCVFLVIYFIFLGLSIYLELYSFHLPMCNIKY